MIWFRRVLAVFLSLVFILVSLPLLALYRVNATLGNPDFYIKHLGQADVYNFVHDELVPSALAEADLGASGSDLSWAKPYLAGFLRETLPPDWLQAQAELVISNVFPYVVGDRDSFAVDIEIKGRVEAAARSLGDTLRRPEVGDRLYGELITRISAASAAMVPPPLNTEAAAMESLIRQVFPREWLLGQTGSAVEQLVPYLVKDRERFTVTVDFLESLDAARPALGEMLGRQEVYSSLMQTLTAQFMAQALQGIRLPAGIAVSGEEAAGIVQQLWPYEAYKAQVPEIVSQAVAYLKGSRPDIEVTLNLTGKPAATAALGKLIDQKLEVKYNSLPAGTPEQVIAMLQSLASGSLPQYRIPGVSYSDLKILAGVDFAEMLAPLVMALPDKMEMALPADMNPLAPVRDRLQEGFTFTEEDLRAALSRTQYAGLQSVRNLAGGGFHLTDGELRRIVSGDGQAAENLRALDGVRNSLGTARRWLVFAWLLPLLVLLAIGLLGGRRWSDRLIWSSLALGAAALVASFVFWPVYGAQEARLLAAVNPDGTGGLGGALAAKDALLAGNIAGDFISGLRLQAVVFLVLALAGTAGGMVWRRRRLSEGG